MPGAALVREDELEQRVAAGQWPHQCSPRVPEQGERSRYSDSNQGQSESRDHQARL